MLENVLEDSCFDSCFERESESSSVESSLETVDDINVQLSSPASRCRVPGDVRCKIAHLKSCLSSVGYNVSEVSALLGLNGYGSFLQTWDISSLAGRFVVTIFCDI